MFRTLRIGLSLTLAFSVLPSGHAADLDCAGFLRRRVIDPIVKSEFVKETRASKGRRLFLKDVTEPSPKYGGFFKRSIGGVPKPTPIAGIYHQLIRRPSAALTRKMFGRAFEPAGLITLPVALVATTLAVNTIDDYYTSQLLTHISAEVAQNSSAYEHLLLSDYRYRFARELFEQGKLTKQQELTQAYLVQMYYDSYYRIWLKNSDKMQSLESQRDFFKWPMFLHLKNTIEHGVPEEPGYVVRHPGKKPDRAQQLRLFNINHRLFFKYMIIPEMVRDSATFEKLRYVPKYQRVIRELIDDPYTVDVMKLLREGRISRDKAQYTLQEFAYWQSVWQEYETLGIVRLKVGGDGRPGVEPLTLEDIRTEMRSELELAHKPA